MHAHCKAEDPHIGAAVQAAAAVMAGDALGLQPVPALDFHPGAAVHAAAGAAVTAGDALGLQPTADLGLDPGATEHAAVEEAAGQVDPAG